jgi:hypothetical protein
LQEQSDKFEGSPLVPVDDPRAKEALDVVEAKRGPDGIWRAEVITGISRERKGSQGRFGLLKTKCGGNVLCPMWMWWIGARRGLTR